MRNHWNPWHGCIKYSEGCRNCYVYFLDGKRDLDASRIYRTKGRYDIPIQKDRHGEYKIKPGEALYVCMTSDFFLPQADKWRPGAWDMIRQRPDVFFTIVTKRIVWAKDRLPEDWGDGYDNVMINATIEMNRYVPTRMRALAELPAKHKGIMCTPILDDIDLSDYLSGSGVEEIICGGENYDGCRECNYEWIKNLHNQAEKADITFSFGETGTRFVKGDKQTWCPNRQKQSENAKLLNLSYHGPEMKINLHMPDGTPVKSPQGENRYFKPGICDKCARQPVCFGCAQCHKCEKRVFT